MTSWIRYQLEFSRALFSRAFLGQQLPFLLSALSSPRAPAFVPYSPSRLLLSFSCTSARTLPRTSANIGDRNTANNATWARGETRLHHQFHDKWATAPHLFLSWRLPTAYIPSCLIEKCSSSSRGPPVPASEMPPSSPYRKDNNNICTEYLGSAAYLHFGIDPSCHRSSRSAIIIRSPTRLLVESARYPACHRPPRFSGLCTWQLLDDAS